MTGKVLSLLASDISANKQLVPLPLVPEPLPASGNPAIEPGLMGPHLPNLDPVDAILMDPQQVEADLLGPRKSGQLGMLLLPETEVDFKLITQDESESSLQALDEFKADLEIVAEITPVADKEVVVTSTPAPAQEIVSEHTPTLDSHADPDGAMDDPSVVVAEPASSRGVLTNFLVMVFTLILNVVLAPIAWLRGDTDDVDDPIDDDDW
jgi:hypothetical protein